jgi:anti-sigma factor RsiW
MNMAPINKNSDSICREVRALLSEYTDNSLSARQAWEVEKHLTGCGDCANEARELQATVQLVRSAPRYDTSDTFMASLHARLDTIDPSVASGPPLWMIIRGWFSGTGDSSRRNRVPVLSLGLAAVAIALLFTVDRPQDTPITVTSSTPTSDGVHVSVASSANSPFSDPAADNLEFRANGRSGSAATPF